MESNWGAVDSSAIIGIAYERTRVMIAAAPPEAAQPTAWLTLTLPDEAVVRDVLVPKVAAPIIRDALGAVGVMPRYFRAWIGIDDDAALLVPMTFPGLSPSKRMQSARATASKFFRDTSPKSLSVKVMDVKDGCLVAYARRDVRDSAEATMRGVGFRTVGVERLSAGWRAALREDALVELTPEGVARLYVFISGGGVPARTTFSDFDSTEGLLRDVIGEIIAHRTRFRFVNSVAVIGALDERACKEIADQCDAQVRRIDDEGFWHLPYGLAAHEFSQELRPAS
jgi:hypothetical protein